MPFDTLPIPRTLTHPKSAANWVAQTINLFPETSSISKEFTAALVELLCKYPESVVSQVLTPGNGLATRYEFLPSLAKFKKELDDAASAPVEAAGRDRRRGEQLAKRAQYALSGPEKEPYTGPIEDVRPGDILSFGRLEEYREFMKKKHGFDPGRTIGLNEPWRDSGRRPFGGPSGSATPASPVPGPDKASRPAPNEELNPFDE